MPAAAPAGTVALNRIRDAKFQAAVGETNTLKAGVAATGTTPDGVTQYEATVTDTTAPIHAGRGCRQQSVDTVVCVDEGTANVHAVLGDGDDSFDLRGEGGGIVRGGAGDDRLTVAGDGARLFGGPGNDVLTGGSAQDQLFAGGGRDELHSGGGRDYITDGDRPGAVDADVLDGGGGAYLDYSSRTRPLRVDLSDPGPDGERGEGDRLSGFTQVCGGRAGDVLVGTPAAEQFGGGGGADRIYARGGNDVIIDLRGTELVVGGPGRDRIDYNVGCGAGPDRQGPGAWFSKSCELLVLLEASDCGSRIAVQPGPVSVSSSGRLVFRVPCQDGAPCPESLTRLTLSTGRRPFRLLADIRVTVVHRRNVPVQLPSGLTNRARRRPVRLRIRLSGPDGCAGRWSEAWRFDVRVPD